MREALPVLVVVAPLLEYRGPSARVKKRKKLSPALLSHGLHQTRRARALYAHRLFARSATGMTSETGCCLCKCLLAGNDVRKTVSCVTASRAAMRCAALAIRVTQMSERHGASRKRWIFGRARIWRQSIINTITNRAAVVCINH